MSLLCSVCLDIHPLGNITKTKGDDVCHDCIRSLYQQVIESEGNYPPRWGGQKVKLKDFDHKILPQELRERYTEREIEYRTPSDFRIYCSWPRPNVTADVGNERAACGAFVGRIPADRLEKVAHEADTIVKPRTRCKTCNTSHCMLCGMASFHLTCINPGPKEDGNAFEGLKLGQDYQICPSKKCCRKVELREGCNHADCVCGQSPCFIYGKAACVRHFRRARENGGCPPWGHPSSQSAIWETEIDDVWATDDVEMNLHTRQDVGFEGRSTGSIGSGFGSEHDDQGGPDMLKGVRNDPGWAAGTARLRQVANNRGGFRADTNTTAVGYIDTPRGARIRNRVGHQTRLQASSDRLAALARIAENRYRLEPPVDRDSYFDPLEAARDSRHVSDPKQATAGAERSTNNAVSVGTRTIDRSIARLEAAIARAPTRRQTSHSTCITS